MAAASTAAIALSDDDDELWNFNSGADSPGPSPAPKPFSASAAINLSDDASDDDDDIKALPRDKRRKLQRLPRLRSPHRRRAAEGKRGSESSTDAVVLEEVRQAPAARAVNQADEFDLAPQQLQHAQPLQRQMSAREQAAQAAMLRNQQALALLRAQLDAPPEELPDREEEEPASGAAAEPAPPQPNASEPPEEHADDEEEKIVVKLRCQREADPTLFRIGKTAPFERMFAAFRGMAVAKAWVQQDTPLRFTFDGDALAAGGTAAGADVEDGCVIEVHW